MQLHISLLVLQVRLVIEVMLNPEINPVHIKLVLHTRTHLIKIWHINEVISVRV